MNYLEVVKKAKKGELVATDLNDVVIALSENNRDRDKKIETIGTGLTNIEQEYPILPTEADDLSNAVRAKGVQVLGGKKAAAYKDKILRQKVYKDIYFELKREYGLFNEKGIPLSYKKLKRKYYKGAFITIGDYHPPVLLESEIESANEIGEIDDE